MAVPGILVNLSDEQKELAVEYVKVTGLFKNRLARFLKLSRPTLDRILSEDNIFFTQLEAADAEFCKDLIIEAKRKNPLAILKSRYPDEFGENTSAIDPETELKRFFQLLVDNRKKEGLDTLQSAT
jgi:hypothetical protein